MPIPRRTFSPSDQIVAGPFENDPSDPSRNQMCQAPNSSRDLIRFGTLHDRHVRWSVGREQFPTAALAAM